MLICIKPDFIPCISCTHHYTIHTKTFFQPLGLPLDGRYCGFLFAIIAYSSEIKWCEKRPCCTFFITGVAKDIILDVFPHIRLIVDMGFAEYPTI